MWASFGVLTLSPLSVKLGQPYSDPFFHRQLHFRSHRRKFPRALIETALEILRNIRVEWIRRQIRRQRAITPMLVHPEARGRDYSGQPARTGPSKLAPFPGAKRRRELQCGDEKPRGNARRAAARNGR